MSTAADLPRPFESLDAMIDPVALSNLLGRRVGSVRLEPFEPNGWSTTESSFVGVYLDEEPAPSLVVKRMDSERDWVVRTTGDQLGRCVTQWSRGLLARFPSEVDPAVVACTRNDAGPDILMHNVAHELFSERETMSERDYDAVLDGMAALHASFWRDPALDDPELGLCPLGTLLTHFSAENLERISADDSAPILGYFQTGWARLPELMDDDMVELVLALQDDPSPLVAALGEFEWTLVHGDLRIANLGLRWTGDTPTLIALDMARHAKGAAVVDLAYHLAVSEEHMPVPKEVAIASYRRHLERRLGRTFDDSAWRRQTEIGWVVGLMFAAPIRALLATLDSRAEVRELARRELSWWSERARTGARHLG